VSYPTKEEIEKTRADMLKINQLESKNSNLRFILGDIFDKADSAVTVLRVILYVASVLGSWFYLHEKVLAIGIATSLTIAHLLIVLKDYLQEQKRKVLEN
jgi:hypothetical protein